jgi:hypothetical protein
MSDRNEEERRALILLFGLLVLGLGAMVLSRQIREAAPRHSTAAAQTSLGDRGCGAGELDLQEALESGDLIKKSVDSREGAAGEATGGSDATESSSGDPPSGQEGSSSTPSDAAAQAPAFQLPVTLMLSPGVPGRGVPGRVRVLGFEPGSPNGPGAEPAFIWTSDRFEGAWPLRVDAQVPVDLDLRIVYAPEGDSPQLTGALRPHFSPQGAIELLYQLDRER